MAKHELYDVAVREVRGEATAGEKSLLASDVEAWRDALQSVIDELDAQAVVEQDKFEDATYDLDDDDISFEDLKAQYDAWKGRMRTFKKHITARLMAVKRMCQEEAGGGSSQAEITNLAIALRRAEYSASDDLWQAAIDGLFEAVDRYLEAS